MQLIYRPYKRAFNFRGSSSLEFSQSILTRNHAVTYQINVTKLYDFAFANRKPTVN
jgi:hypothetical protein